MKEKKKKLNLDDLKVQSFVTSLPEDRFNTIKGGEECDSQDPNICECDDVLSCGDVAYSLETSPCKQAC